MRHESTRVTYACVSFIPKYSYLNTMLNLLSHVRGFRGTLQALGSFIKSPSFNVTSDTKAVTSDTRENQVSRAVFGMKLKGVYSK